MYARQHCHWQDINTLDFISILGDVYYLSLIKPFSQKKKYRNWKVGILLIGRDRHGKIQSL